jgi:hypothetical protein
VNGEQNREQDGERRLIFKIHVNSVGSNLGEDVKSRRKFIEDNVLRIPGSGGCEQNSW